MSRERMSEGVNCRFLLQPGFAKRLFEHLLRGAFGERLSNVLPGKKPELRAFDRHISIHFKKRSPG